MMPDGSELASHPTRADSCRFILLESFAHAGLLSDDIHA